MLTNHPPWQNKVAMEYIAEKLDKLDDINKTLERQNEIMKQALDFLPKPASRLNRILETLLLFVGVFGFIGILDTIFKWISGG